MSILSSPPRSSLLVPLGAVVLTASTPLRAYVNKSGYVHSFSYQFFVVRPFGNWFLELLRWFGNAVCFLFPS